MSSLATDGLSAGSGDTLPPKLILALVGSFVGFGALVIGFFLVSRKTCLPPRTSSTAGNAHRVILPFHSHHLHGVSAPRRGLVHSTGSLTRSKYRDCLKISRSKGSAPSLEFPSAPTSLNAKGSSKVFERSDSWLSGTASLDSSTSAPASPVAPPLAYVAAHRGLVHPTGNVRHL